MVIAMVALAYGSTVAKAKMEPNKNCALHCMKECLIKRSPICANCIKECMGTPPTSIDLSWSTLMPSSGTH